MTKQKRTVKVVAAAIENENKEILCALRSPRMSLPNVWEFPGGKAEEGEDIFHALQRGIKEELQCTVKDLELFHEHRHEYDKFIVHLIVIKCKIAEGIPVPNEHSKLIWLKRENLCSIQWAPADLPAVKKLINEEKRLSF